VQIGLFESPLVADTEYTLTYTRPVSGGFTGSTSGNIVEDFSVTPTFAPQVAPQLDGATAPSLASNGTSLTLTFDETLAYSATATSAFTVTVDGSAVDVSSVQVSSQASGMERPTSVLTLASPVLQGATVTVAYTAPDSARIGDLAGNLAESFTAQAVTNNSTQVPDVTPPSLVLPPGVIASNGTELTLNFGETLAAVVPATSAFTVTVDGSAVGVSSVANSDATSVLTLASAVSQGATVTVSYAAPESGGLQDAAGNEVVTFTNQAVMNFSTQVADVTAPQLASGTAPSLASDGTTLTLTFDETLAAASGSVSNAFTVTAGGSPVTVSAVANSGATSVLTLASAVSGGATVEVTYTKPNSGGLQDAAANEVATFTDVNVTNNVPAPEPEPEPEPEPSPSPAPAPAPAATTTTTEPTTTTTEPVTVSTTPSLVTGENQAALSATAGAARVLVNGEEVALTLTSTGADDAGAAAPEERTAEQIVELQEAADGLVERLDTAAGGDSGLEVVDTDTGAEIDGLFDDTRVPVEDVIIAESTTFTGLYASRDEGGSPNPIRSEMLEMERGDQVAVFFYGLPAGESAELVLMSTPYLLGTATADAQGNFSRVLSAPEAILAGDHTLVTATDSLTVSLGIRITDPNVVRDEATALRLPATGGGAPVAPALFFTVLGSLLLIHSRRREVPGN
jgi:uncharacterized repeat protein (TIGR02059 family)